MTRKQMIKRLDTISRQWGGPGLPANIKAKAPDAWLRKMVKKMAAEGKKCATHQN